MGADVEVSHSGTVGEGEPERGLLSLVSASGFEDVGDGAGAEGVTFEGGGDGGGEFLRPVVVEQGEQSGGVRAKRFSPLGEALEEGGGGGNGDAEPVAGGVGVGLAGGGEQTLEMVGVLDGPSGVVAAGMASELGLAIEDADAGGAGGGRRRRASGGTGR